MVKEDELLEDFGNILEWLSNSDEKVDAKDVAEIIIRTTEMYFKLLKEKNPMLHEICLHADMTLTTSMIFALCSLTSKRDYVESLKEKYNNAEKPN